MTTEADVREVEAVNRALYAAVENADLDAMTALWAPDAEGRTAVCVHPGWPPVLGHAHVLRSWALVMAGTPYIQFFLTDVRTQVLGDVAVVTCAENILTGMGGSADDGFSGGRVVTTNVFRRTQDGWRALVHHASPVLAGEEHGDGEDGPDGAGGQDDGRGAPA
ncbi:MAG: nuclear transport factor 2 family protein [Actinomycetes bacterium]